MGTRCRSLVSGIASESSVNWIFAIRGDGDEETNLCDDKCTR